MTAWYYAQGNQRQGPVPEEEIRRLVADGTVRAETLVWTEGMAAWASARETPLAAHVASATAAAAQPPPAQPAAQRARYGPLPQRAPAEESRAIDSLFRWSWICLLAGVLCCPLWLGTGVLALILLHRHWTLVSDGHARTSPGLAVGLLFVPVFNLYWNFVAYHGLAQDMNAYCRRHDVPAPPASESLALTWCTLHFVYVVPYVNLVLLPVVLPVHLVVLVLLHRSLRETAHAILRHRTRQATPAQPQPAAPASVTANP